MPTVIAPLTPKPSPSRRNLSRRTASRHRDLALTCGDPGSLGPASHGPSLPALKGLRHAVAFVSAIELDRDRPAMILVETRAK